MDDSLSVLTSTARSYRCPDQHYVIDRAVHLGRLAAFHAVCRDCPHRDDNEGLSPEQRRAWQEIARRQTPMPRFGGEAFEGMRGQQFDAALAGRFSTALGSLVAREPSSQELSTVLVGSDGNWATAELVAAACQSLQLCGCHAIEAGAATSAALVALASDIGAGAALLVGNLSGLPHALGLKVWGPAGQPWSSPGGLDALRQRFESTPRRTRRRGGTIGRMPSDGYLQSLAPLFYGLRPLRFVLDTTCARLVGWLGRLNENAACEVIQPSAAEAPLAPEGQTSFIARRLHLIGHEVLRHDAHFGVWIDGDAETLQLVDERGRHVRFEQLLKLLAQDVSARQPTAGILVETATAEAAAQASPSAQTVHAGPPRSTRENFWERMRTSCAQFGGQSPGRFWFGGQTPASDALLALCLLLGVLSQSDRPLSAVLDSAWSGVYK